MLFGSSNVSFRSTPKITLGPRTCENTPMSGLNQAMGQCVLPVALPRTVPPTADPRTCILALHPN